MAAALVGTFLGILLCYGVVGPLAARLEHRGEMESQFLQVLRTAIVAFARGSSPILAVEYARRSIPVELRPSFIEFESGIRREAHVPAAPAAPGMSGPEAVPQNHAAAACQRLNRPLSLPGGAIPTRGPSMAEPGKWPTPIL